MLAKDKWLTGRSNMTHDLEVVDAPIGRKIDFHDQLYDPNCLSLHKDMNAQNSTWRHSCTKPFKLQFLREYEQILILKSVWNCGDPRISNRILKKKYKFGRLCYLIS